MIVRFHLNFQGVKNEKVHEKSAGRTAFGPFHSMIFISLNIIIPCIGYHGFEFLLNTFTKDGDAPPSN